MSKHYIHTNADGYIVGSTTESDGNLSIAEAITYGIILFGSLKFLSSLRHIFDAFLR